MNTYYIDGNNVIGKVSWLSAIQRTDRQRSREALARWIDEYFVSRKVKVVLFLDGHPGLSIPTIKISIVYSEKKSADDCIRKAVSDSKSRSRIIVVTSDRSLADFARACACAVIPSEKLHTEIRSSGQQDEESKRLDALEKSNNEFLKLFSSDE